MSHFLAESIHLFLHISIIIHYGWYSCDSELANLMYLFNLLIQSSPKAQQRNSSSPQSTTGKKKSIIETLFGHRTKSKGAESHTVVADGKDEEYVNVDGQDHETENGTAKEETDTTHKREDKPTHPAETDKSTLINPAQQLHDNNVKEEVVAVLKSGDVPCEPSGAEANDVKPSVSEDGQNLEEKTLEVKQSKDSTVETVCINQESDVRIEERVGQEITSKEAEVIKPIAEQDNEVVEMNAVESKPMVQELSVDGTSEETAVQEAKGTFVKRVSYSPNLVIDLF